MTSKTMTNLMQLNFMHIYHYKFRIKTRYMHYTTITGTCTGMQSLLLKSISQQDESHACKHTQRKTVQVGH